MHELKCITSGFTSDNFMAMLDEAVLLGRQSDVRSYFWPNSNRFFAAY